MFETVIPAKTLWIALMSIAYHAVPAWIYRFGVVEGWMFWICGKILRIRSHMLAEAPNKHEAWLIVRTVGRDLDRLKIPYPGLTDPVDRDLWIGFLARVIDAAERRDINEARTLMWTRELTFSRYRAVYADRQTETDHGLVPGPASAPMDDD